MVSSTYRTGSWLGIVRSGSVIVLESNTNPEIVTRLWEFLGEDPTIHGVLNEVTESFGTGLTGLPSFAILVQRDKLHAILRGDITLLAQKNGAVELVSGRDVTTWSERSLTLPDALELTLAESDSGATELELPMGEAVVRLQSLRLVLSGTFTAAVPLAGASSTEMDDVDSPATAWAADHNVTMTSNTRAASFAPAALPEVEDAAPEAVPAVEPELDNEPEDSAPTAAHESADLAEQPVAQEQAISLAKEDSFVSAEQPAEPEVDAYASFAMAAEAADAEWSAQLEPVQANGEDDINDLNLTIRPDLHEEESAAGSSESSASDVAREPGQEYSVESESALPDAGMEEASEAEAGQEQSAQGNPASDGQDAPAGSSADDAAFTTSYDHLWGPTVARSVEDAAIRLDENGQPIAAVHADPVVPPLPSLPPMTGTDSAGGNSADGDASDPAEETPADAGSENLWQGSASEAAQGNAPHAFGGTESLMIDSVPWGAPAAQSQSAPAAAEEPFDPDHDGQTVMSGDVQRDLAPAAAAPLESRPPTGPMVLARLCLHGHANPPSRSQCSACGALLNSEPREVGRPRLGIMHISSGESVELDHSLIIGRQPSVSRVMGGAMPRLVQVKSGNDDISRSHVEVRLDGWDVLLVDLKATNGTVLVREGQAPRRLSQGEQAILLNGDIAELGDGISLLFDGLL